MAKELLNPESKKESGLKDSIWNKRAQNMLMKTKFRMLKAEEKDVLKSQNPNKQDILSRMS